MAAFGGLIYVVILIFIISSVIKRAKNAGGAVNKPVKPGQSVAGKGTRRTGFTNYRPHKDIISVSRDMGDAKGSSTLRDDRNNDWLARQLREEHRAFKMTSEMFDLKIEHASHCDARLLEQFHRRNCTAEGVDLANGKTLYHK